MTSSAPTTSEATKAPSSDAPATTTKQTVDPDKGSNMRRAGTATLTYPDGKSVTFTTDKQCTARATKLRTVVALQGTSADGQYLYANINVTADELSVRHQATEDQNSERIGDAQRVKAADVGSVEVTGKGATVKGIPMKLSSGGTGESSLVIECAMELPGN